MAAPIYVFDADGVVIEPWGFAKLLEAKYKITRPMTQSFFTGPFESCLKGLLSIEDILKPYLDEWKWQETPSEFMRLWLVAENQPRHSVLSYVQNLRNQGYVCCLASNQERLRAEYIRKEMDFTSLFDYLYFSCDLEAVKPEARFFECIQNDLRCVPEDIYFWDDSASYISGATQAGWNATLFVDEKSLQVSSG